MATTIKTRLKKALKDSRVMIHPDGYLGNGHFGLSLDIIRALDKNFPQGEQNGIASYLAAQDLEVASTHPEILKVVSMSVFPYIYTRTRVLIECNRGAGGYYARMYEAAEGQGMPKEANKRFFLSECYSILHAGDDLRADGKLGPVISPDTGADPEFICMPMRMGAEQSGSMSQLLTDLGSKK